jgi:hypothetical protein
MLKSIFLYKESVINMKRALNSKNKVFFFLSCFDMKISAM